MSDNVPNVMPLLEVESIESFRKRKEEAQGPQVELSRELTWYIEAKKFLQGIPPEIMENIRIICVSGKARLGKSTILTLLVKFLDPAAAAIDTDSSLFEIGHGGDTVTEGMWIYPKVLEYNQKHFLLIDTEGTQRGSDQVTSQITALACFLSSLSVLMVDRGVSNTDLEALNRMQSIVSVASRNAKDLVSLMPDLMVLAGRAPARWFVAENFVEAKKDVANIDFESQEFQENCNSVLHQQLDPARHPGDQAELNAVRQIIIDCFPNIHNHVTTMASPADLDELEECRLLKGSVFARSMVASMKRALSLAPAKRFGGVAFTPDTLAKAMDHMLRQVSDNPLPIQGVLFAMQLDSVIAKIDPLLDQMMADIKTDIEKAPKNTTIERHLQAANSRVEKSASEYVKAMVDDAILQSVQKEAIQRFRLLAEQRVNLVEAKLRDEVINDLSHNIGHLKQKVATSEIQRIAQAQGIANLEKEVAKHKQDAVAQSKKAEQLQASIAQQNQTINNLNHRLNHSGGGGGGCALL